MQFTETILDCFIHWEILYQNKHMYTQQMIRHPIQSGHTVLLYILLR